MCPEIHLVEDCHDAPLYPEAAAAAEVCIQAEVAAAAVAEVCIQALEDTEATEADTEATEADIQALEDTGVQVDTQASVCIQVF